MSALQGVTESLPMPPPRLTERTVVHRAVQAMRKDIRLRAMDPTRRLFWLDCVMEVHGLGDADGLPFGQDGDPFEDHAEFAKALGGDPAHLEAFLRRGVLVRLPDGGIDLPEKLNLKPREKLVNGAAPITSARRREIMRAAANARWARRAGKPHLATSDGTPVADASDASDSPASGMHDASPHASGSHASGMHDASAMHGPMHPAMHQSGMHDASPMHPDASASSRAPSLSLTSFSSLNPLVDKEESEKESQGERECARAGEPASGMHPDASEHASGDASTMHESMHEHASTDASGDASGRRAGSGSRRSRKRQTVEGHRIPEDWQPSAADRLEARRRGLDPDEVALKFRDHFLGKAGPDALSPDWSARYRNWLRNEAQPSWPAQRTLTMGVAGGVAGSAASAPATPDAAIEARVAAAEAAVAPALAAQWARVRERLRAEVGDADYRSWLREMTLSGVDGDEVTVNLPGAYLRDRVNSQYGARLKRLWQAQNPDIRRVEFRVAPKSGPDPPQAAD